MSDASCSLSVASTTRVSMGDYGMGDQGAASPPPTPRETEVYLEAPKYHRVHTMATACQSPAVIVISTYRSLARLVSRLPEKQRPGAWNQLREGFRRNTDESSPEKIAQLLHEAGEKIAFLRIVTPKKVVSGNTTNNQSGITRWVYRSSGEKDAAGKGTKRKTGMVVSNFDGNNLDPCSVTRHNSQLKRMGFVNNLHAKGLF